MPGHEESWTSIELDLDIQGSYQLYFLVSYPSGLGLDLIAVDDFTFSGCDALNPPPPVISCDFESDLCGWSQVTGGDQADWSRAREGVWYENTGPGYDHTTGQGYYLYFTSHGHQAGEPGQEMADYGPASYVPGDRCVASTDRFRHPLVLVVSVTSVCKHLEDGKHGE